MVRLETITDMVGNGGKKGAGGNSHDRAKERAKHPELFAPMQQEIAPKGEILETSQVSNRFLSTKTLQAFGGSGLLLGIAAMIFPVLFWSGIALFIVSGVIWSLDVWAERYSIGSKLTLQLFIVSIVALVMWRIVFFPADPQISAAWAKSDYKPGTNINGLEWHKGLSELRVFISNPTDRDFSDFDFSIITKESVFEVSQATSIPCNRINDDNVITFHDSANDVFEHAPSTEPIRFRCDKLPGGASMNFVLSLANDDDLRRGVSNGDLSDGMFSQLGPKRKPPRIIVSAKYSVLLRPHSGYMRVEVGDLTQP